MRTLAPLVIGAGFILSLLFALFTNSWSLPDPSATRSFHLEPKELDLESNGIFGKYDRQQLQRGFQVYKEVCSSCHSLRLVAFNDLKGLGYNDAEVKAIAKNWAVQQPAVNPNTGENILRPGLPSDHFPSPFANETAARAANNHALPPDLSLITKAREGGAAYVYSLITGYQDIPAAQLKQFPDSKPGANLYYNPYFANLNIAMPPPLKSDNQVSYGDGTKATKAQMAKDVAAFLTWTAEPTLETRHHVGVAAVLYLLIFSILCYLSYRTIWANKEH